MTKFATLTNEERHSESKLANGPARELKTSANANIGSLAEALRRHAQFEKASFHTPGHKGRLTHTLPFGSSLDLTELPGLDDLSHPQGVLRQLEQRTARLWQARESLISVNGASGALIASICAVASGKKRLLIPRNTHRSAISALIISGLEPIWYEPVWDSRWGMWTGVSESSIRKLLSSTDTTDIAGMLVVSPTYAGAVSDIAALAEICHEHDIPLIVDEAHGAHFFGASFPASALIQRADLVVHSLHKTLSALTQTGLVHIGKNCPARIDGSALRPHLNLVHSSSPSYPLLHSVESNLDFLETDGERTLARAATMRRQFELNLAATKDFELFNSKFDSDPFHILIACSSGTAEELYDFCAESGLFAEAIVGRGVLFLMGVGTSGEDMDYLASTLKNFAETSGERLSEAPPSFWIQMEQLVSPRQAFLMPSQVVPVQDAVGQIAAECIAPCPPGIPICVPGQKIHPEVMNLTSIKEIRVVRHPDFVID